VSPVLIVSFLAVCANTPSAAKTTRAAAQIMLNVDFLTYFEISQNYRFSFNLKEAQNLFKSPRRDFAKSWMEMFETFISLPVNKTLRAFWTNGARD
jgi:hypothetical protein